ncbi:Ribonuclease H-like domain [Trinorchestia longiramus]|nr:Ribonuclease H-like domain [Trinorchestia longiramus]
MAASQCQDSALEARPSQATPARNQSVLYLESSSSEASHGAAQHWKLGAADWTKETSHLNAHTDQTHVGPRNAIMGKDFLLGVINSAAEKSVPMSTGRTRISRANPWWDAACSKAVAQCRRAKGQLFHYPSQENLIRYKPLEAAAKRTILLKKQKFCPVSGCSHLFYSQRICLAVHPKHLWEAKVEDQQLRYFLQKDKITSFHAFKPECNLQKQLKNLIISRSKARLVCLFMTDNFNIKELYESKYSDYYTHSICCQPLKFTVNPSEKDYQKNAVLQTSVTKARGNDDYTLKQLGLARRGQQTVFETQAIQVLVSMKALIPLRVQTGTLSPVPHWSNFPNFISVDAPFKTAYHGQEAANEAIMQEDLNAKYSGFTQIFTDGSKQASGSTAAALFVPTLPQGVGWKLNATHTVLGEELFGIHKALTSANKHPALHNKDIVILSDSQSALYQLKNIWNPNYRHIVYDVQK